MSESDANKDGSNNWQDMLRAILGPQAADDIIRAFEEQGINPDNQFQNMVSPENFQMVANQVRAMLGSSGDGPVNWQIAEKMARDTVSSKHLDTLSTADGEAARTSLRTASLWLDVATSIDPTTGPNMAWTRLDWIAHSLPTYRRLLDPVGANISRAFINAISEQTQGMQGNLPGMPEGMQALPMGTTEPNQLLERIIASVLGMQYGSALAELAISSFGTTDTGLPLIEGSSAALVPSNIAEFAEGLDVEKSEVELYIAVREAAAARLYTRVPWLRSRVLDSVAEFASGIEIDTSSIEEQVRNMSFQDPNEINNIDLSNVFVVELNVSQQDAITRLEHLLSLVEGWVTEVSARAVAAHLPNAVRLREMFTRRYATDNPARHVWGAQMGVELEPRMLRESVAFWQMAEQRMGIDGRDGLWSHPDLLPDASDLENPEGFFSDEEADIEAELDSFLEDLFNEESQKSGPHEPKYGESEPRDPSDGSSGTEDSGQDGPEDSGRGY